MTFVLCRHNKKISVSASIENPTKKWKLLDIYGDAGGEDQEEEQEFRLPMAMSLPAQVASEL